MIFTSYDSVVLSSVAVKASIADGCVYELEQVICEVLKCPSILVTKGQGNRLALSPEQGRAVEKCRHVFIIALGFSELASVVSAAKKHLSSVSNVFVYVFDPFIGRQRLGWRDSWLRLHPKYRTIGSLKNMQIFIPVQSMTTRLSTLFNSPVHYLPIGVDLKRVSGSTTTSSRFIDVNGYGRQPPGILNEINNKSPDDFLFYWTGHTKLGMCSDLSGQRRIFWKLLQSSKIALAYGPMQYDPDQRFNAPFIPQRWYESLAAGCIVAGSRPTDSDFDSLLGWENSMIELQGDWSEQANKVLQLSQDADFLDHVRTVNLEKIKSHDWRIRISTMNELLQNNKFMK